MTSGESLTRERLGLPFETAIRVVVGACSHEVKAEILALMGESEYHRPTDLSQELTAAQGKNPEWVRDRDRIRDFFVRSFIPLGLALETPDPWHEGSTPRISYILTPLGIIAKAAAGHSLETSLSIDDISLIDIWSKQASRGTRPAAARYRFYEQVISQDVNYEGDLLLFPITVKELRPDRRQSLQRSNLTGYGGKRLEKPIVSFALGKIDLEDLNLIKKSTFSREMRDVLQNLFSSQAEISLVDVINDLIVVNPEYAKRDGYKFHRMVSQYLRRFTDKGALTRTDETQPIIEQNPEQVGIAEYAVNLVRKLQEGDPDFITEGLKKADTIMADEDSVKRLAAKAKKTSPNAYALPAEDRDRQILEVVPTHPDNASLSELEQRLRERGIRLSQSRLRQKIGHISTKGEVVMSKEKGRVVVSKAAE